MLDDINHMKKIADLLVPHSHPMVDFVEEQETLCLKQRFMAVDGYDLIVCLSKSNYQGNYVMESLQIQSYYAPYLPFNVVCKVAKAFLGRKNLSYIEFIKNSKKVYCWMLRFKDGVLMSAPKKSRLGSYEDLEFRILNPGSIDLLDAQE